MAKTLVAVILTIGILGLPAVAAADVTLYSELMHSVDGSDATLMAYGVAEGDEWCADVIDVDVYLFQQPGNSLLASNGNSDWCYASATAVYTQSIGSWEQSEYEARATSPGHYCASAGGYFGVGIMTYRLDYIESEFPPNARYVRCNTSNGTCQAFFLGKSTLENPPTWPLYIYLQLLAYKHLYFGPYVCYAISGQNTGQTACTADPLPLFF